MKLIKEKLRKRVWNNVQGGVIEHVPWDSPVREQIRKNFEFGWGDGLITLKIRNPNLNIIRNLNETT